MNGLIMLVLFAPLVGFLVSGVLSLTVSFVVLLYSIVFFIVIPLVASILVRAGLFAHTGAPGSTRACCRGSNRSRSSLSWQCWSSFARFRRIAYG